MLLKGVIKDLRSIQSTAKSMAVPIPFSWSGSMRGLVLIAAVLAGLAGAPSAHAQQPKPKAKVTAADTTKAARASSGPWTGSTKGKTYYKTGCSGANRLAAGNRIYFASEDEAKKAGYSRSRSKGC